MTQQEFDHLKKLPSIPTLLSADDTDINPFEAMCAPDGDGGFKLTTREFKLPSKEDFPDLGEAE